MLHRVGLATPGRPLHGLSPKVVVVEVDNGHKVHEAIKKTTREGRDVRYIFYTTCRCMVL
jgi:hypothetical protein